MELVAEVFGVYAAPSVFGASPVVVLRSEDGRVLPIYIGISEAIAIHSAMKNQVPPRPMTHDLMVDVINKLKGKVEKVIIDDLIDNTFYARLIIKQNDHEIEVDARPSDSIAIAVRLACPIYIDEKVLDEAGNEELPEDYVEFDQVM
ncbi:bifunctional nuclease family protein [Archaeoglobales archaeon]|nr:MAG: bifunctional nuclease family protein [Archaeoglobales archaeon]